MSKDTEFKVHAAEETEFKLRCNSFGKGWEDSFLAKCKDEATALEIERRWNACDELTEQLAASKAREERLAGQLAHVYCHSDLITDERQKAPAHWLQWAREEAGK